MRLTWPARVLALLSMWLSACAFAQSADPWADWQTATSEHFRVHYRATQRAQAEAVARAAERVYPRVTEALKWQPRGRTEVVVYSEIDLANGFTTPLPFNLMGIFLAPPDEGQLLDNTPWLDLLLVHEFTHAVHLDKVRGAPKVLQSIFGNVVWFIPNIFAPGWTLEGIATYMESEPAAGRGRLQGPMFEAWLRAERAKGFIKLSELNADGRTLPVAKQYLYGAYFYEFLARKYGADKPQAFIERYSGNIGFVPRLHSGPYDATGKMMDTLWDEFLADLAQQVDARAAPIKARPEVLGDRVLGPLFDIPAIAALPDGDLLAVLDDGLGAMKLSRIGADGQPRPITTVNFTARVDVAPDGGVLVAQPDLCNTFYLAYDLYRLEGDSLRQLTSCAHLRRATQAGKAIVALQLDAGQTRLVRMAADGSDLKVLYTPAAGEELVDLAASPDGQRVSVIGRRDGNDWRLSEFDLAQPGAAPRLVLRRTSPMQGLRHGRQGLEFIALDGGVYNVWRLDGGTLKRLTHAHTSVVAQAGTAGDGSLATVVVAAGGYELRRLKGAAALQTAAVDTRAPAPPAPVAVAAEPPALGEGYGYSAWRTLYPRSWLPAITSDRGLTAFGASTAGADALFFHSYAALAQWETSQKELIGSFEYSFMGAHNLAIARSLKARRWTGESGDETITTYDRETKAQWLSLVPWLRIERRVVFGIGAALDREERIDVEPRTVARRRDERIAAALLDFDTSGSNWYSEGPNRGLHATLLYETYKPFNNVGPNGEPTYDGAIARLDLRGYVPLGRSVLGLRWTEARAKDATEPFQLGGATDEQLQLGYVLNSRELALRGYRGDEPELLGRNARVASVEWRVPFADIDRHGMAPPFGINRLSGAFFFEAGGAWNTGNSPERWHRGVGFELLGEVRLLYALGLQLRAGVARGLDEPKGTRGYLTVGRAF